MKAIAALSWIVGCSLLPPVLAAQAPADSNPPASSSPDGYVIDAAKLVREGGARSIAELLISQVPGLLVVPGSGLTGAGARVRFAGARSLVGDRAPLVLVDGIRVDAAEDASLVPLGGAGPSRLDDLRPEDVESVEVVRGPASAAIYGAGAAAGVILIRTKTGRSGPARWEGYAQGALGFEPSRWPANYGGVDLDNPDVRMRTGGCSLAAQGAGLCVQDFVQSFNPLVQRSPFATAMRRQIGFSGSGGPRWGAFRVAGGLDSDDGAYSTCRPAALSVPSQGSSSRATLPRYPGTCASRCTARSRARCSGRATAPGSPGARCSITRGGRRSTGRLGSSKSAGPRSPGSRYADSWDSMTSISEMGAASSIPGQTVTVRCGTGHPR